MGATQPLRIIRDRYRLDGLIGEGGMASVWRAWDLTLQRPIAVKLLFPRDSHTTEALVDRFLREARIAASVQHRNVIHIVDFGTTLEGQPFMVMELLEGETLAHRLRREKPLPLPVPHVVQIGHLTLRGLGAVHAAGIIHRDLKPENVYLKNEGGVVYPKILDFGISRSIEPAARSATTTRDGVIVGTPEYMSPEQARGVKQLDYRTDLYSMGVVLYEALTGKLPYSSENVGDLIIKIVTGCAVPVHEIAPQVPRAVSDVIARAMARLPGDRFVDATEMQEALLAAYRPQEPSIATLPLMSDLPPISNSANAPLSLPRSPRPTTTSLPRTQALRIPVLVPANQVDTRPAPAQRPGLPETISGFPSRPPSAVPTKAPEQRALPGLISSSPSDPPTPSAEEADAPATISGFPSLPPAAAEGTPRLTPSARNWSQLLQRTAAAGRALLPRTGATLKLPTLTAAAALEPEPQPPPEREPEREREPPPSAAESAAHALVLGDDAVIARPDEDITRPTSPSAAPPAPELHIPRARRPWLAPVAAGAALLIAGVAILSAAPSAPAKPPPRAASPAPTPPPAPVLPATVTLQLAGVPSNASVTLDGAPASPTMELPRGVQPRSVAVLVPGMQPWHVSYVPNADQSLEVQLTELPPSAAKAPAPAAKPKRPASKGRHPGALRVPDF